MSCKRRSSWTTDLDVKPTCASVGKCHGAASRVARFSRDNRSQVLEHAHPAVGRLFRTCGCLLVLDQRDRPREVVRRFSVRGAPDPCIRSAPSRCTPPVILRARIPATGRCPAGCMFLSRCVCTWTTGCRRYRLAARSRRPCRLHGRTPGWPGPAREDQSEKYARNSVRAWNRVGSQHGCPQGHEQHGQSSSGKPNYHFSHQTLSPQTVFK